MALVAFVLAVAAVAAGVLVDWRWLLATPVAVGVAVVAVAIANGTRAAMSRQGINPPRH